MKKMNNTIDKYAETKNQIRATMEANGEKYPTTMNGLKDEFIAKTFAPHLDREDLIWLINTRKDYLKKAEPDSNGKVKTQNWYPAFRSAVGQKFFPEFIYTGNNKKKSDDNADFLENLLANMESNPIGA